MGKMRILDESGDTTIEWDVDDDSTVRHAEDTFRWQIRNRQMAFARPARASIEEAERVYSFDPTVEEILWVRPIQGG